MTRRSLPFWIGAMLSAAWQPLAAQTVSHADTPIAAPAEPNAIPLYGKDTPGRADSEIWARTADGKTSVRNVTRPVLVPVLPDPATANGAAIVVAPGGAFMALSMDGEGFDVARLLAQQGIAAFVLKYRLLPTPADPAEASRYTVQQIIAGMGDPTKMPTLRSDHATQDGLAALKLVRGGAARWHIDPARVGMIGFSAGAMTGLATVLNGQPADRPAFLGYIYGPQATTTIPADAPPLFDALAFDDPLFRTMGFPLVAEWLKAHRPVEVHAYQKGGHGFGLGRPGTTTQLVLQEFVAWVRMNGFLTPKG